MACFRPTAVGDDVELYTDAGRGTVQERFHFLRQQAIKGTPSRPAASGTSSRRAGRICATTSAASR